MLLRLLRAQMRRFANAYQRRGRIAKRALEKTAQRLTCQAYATGMSAT
jgi:hypothetical protein